MNDSLAIRHVVSLAGVVHEPPAPDGTNEQRTEIEPLRVAGALVEIMVEEAPRVFQEMIEARKADPTWSREDKRIDRTRSRRDGAFFFIDLPPGDPDESYRLRVSLPGSGGRYQPVETAPVAVQQNPPGSPVQVAWVDVELPVTEIRGRVADQHGAAIAGAKVQLRGETHSARAGEDGLFRLARLRAGNQIVEVSAARFVTFQQKVELRPGQVLTIDVQLQPKPTSSH